VQSTTASRSRQISDDTLIGIGAAIALLAAALRFLASFIPADTTGAPVEALYFVIDVCLLLGLVALFWGDPAGRTRIGTTGFVVAAIGCGLLIGPEPTNSDIDLYAAGATGVTLGYALLATAWRHSEVVPRWVRLGFLASLALGAASPALGAIGLTVTGLVFSASLAGAAVAVRRHVGRRP